MRQVVLAIAVALMVAGCGQNTAPGSSSGPANTGVSVGPADCAVTRLAGANAVLNAQPYYTYSQSDFIGGILSVTYIAPDRWETITAPGSDIVRIGKDQWSVLDGTWTHSTVASATMDPNGGPVQVASNASAGQDVGDGTGDCLYVSPDGMVTTTIDGSGRPVLIVTPGKSGTTLQTVFDYATKPTIKGPPN
jgi:hypothetical protein